MESKNIISITGRSTGMKALRKRGEEIEKIAAEKRVIIGWENRGNHYLVYIKTLANQSFWSEVVLTRGVPTVQKINAFYDIFEKELEKINL